MLAASASIVPMMFCPNAALQKQRTILWNLQSAGNGVLFDYLQNEAIACLCYMNSANVSSFPGNMSSNGSANGFAHQNEPSSSSLPTPQVRQRSTLNDAASMIGNGGLGNPSRHLPTPPRFQELNEALDFYEKQFLPNHPRSLAGIAFRSFVLGVTLTISTILFLYLLRISSTAWRTPFFITCLSGFHFLEFYTTALANTSDAKISSFLLSSNGSAYTIAHTAAFIECLLWQLVLPFVSPAWAAYLSLPAWAHYLALIAGLTFIGIGQTCRSLAMLQAGSNFSHLVRHTKSPTHVLITTGVYSHLRHPSYFGFFWWGIGTQLVSGNVVCLAGYAYVLWTFFSRRIKGEEDLLTKFFGDDYVNYKTRTRIGIPLI